MHPWLLILKLTNLKIAWICEQELELSAQSEHCSLFEQFHGNSTGLSIFCPQLFVDAIVLLAAILSVLHECTDPDQSFLE